MSNTNPKIWRDTYEVVSRACRDFMNLFQDNRSSIQMGLITEEEMTRLCHQPVQDVKASDFRGISALLNASGEKS
jgi:hypothetical protein